MTKTALDDRRRSARNSTLVANILALCRTSRSARRPGWALTFGGDKLGER